MCNPFHVNTAHLSCTFSSSDTLLDDNDDFSILHNLDASNSENEIFSLEYSEVEYSVEYSEILLKEKEVIPATHRTISPDREIVSPTQFYHNTLSSVLSVNSFLSKIPRSAALSVDSS